MGNANELELVLVELSSVSVCRSVVPTGTVPKSSDTGVTAGNRPLPLNCTGVPSMPKAAAVTVSIPATGLTAVGVNTTPMVHAAPDAKVKVAVVGQFPPATPAARTNGSRDR